MKRKIGIVILCLIVGACNSGKKVVYAPAEPTFVEPVEVKIYQGGRDTLVVEEARQRMTVEAVMDNEDSGLKHYCVIVGSFRYYENAVRLRNSLQQQGFYDSSVIGSNEGIYRVSIACEESLLEADADLTRVRSQLPRFGDAWVLEVED